MILNNYSQTIFRDLHCDTMQLQKIFGRKKALEFEAFINQDRQAFEAPTKKFIQLAKFLNIPFAYLFLSEMPKKEKVLADFRNATSGISHNLEKSINASKKKQEWYRNYLIRNNEPKFLESITLRNDTDIINLILQITHFKEVSLKPKGHRLKFIKDHLENLNFIIQQSSMAGNITRNTITLSECRGYAIYDEYAPLIFINAKDTSENGKIFTLLHELAHILFKHKGDGISSYDFNSSIDIEYRCNNIAGEILMPERDFRTKWDKNKNIQANIDNLEKVFLLASSLAIATKALLLKFIDYDNYKRFREQILSQTKPAFKGGNYFANIITSNSTKFTKSVIIETTNGYNTYKDALNILDIKKYSVFDKIAKELKI